jgi:hypothetical protein
MPILHLGKLRHSKVVQVNQKPRADKDENKKVENFQNIPPFEIYI